MKITKEQLKQIIMEELNEETGDEVMSRFQDQVGPSRRSQMDATVAQETAEFNRIVDWVIRRYGDRLVKDVATKIVRMVLRPPEGQAALQEDERAEAEEHLAARYAELTKKVVDGEQLTRDENQEYLMIAATLDPEQGAGE